MKIAYIFWIVLICLLLQTPLLEAQSWSVQHFSTEDGLPGNITYGVLQDKDSYIWVPTNNGLCRYDGREFKLYNSPLIKNNEILKCKEVMGLIWLYTYGGRFFYIEQDEIKPFVFPENQYLIDWEEVDENRMLVLCRSKNLYYTTYLLKKTKDSIKKKELLTIRSKYNKELLKTTKGVYAYNTKNLFYFDEVSNEMILKFSDLGTGGDAAESIYENEDTILAAELASSQNYLFVDGVRKDADFLLSDFLKNDFRVGHRDKWIYKDSKNRLWYKRVGEIWLMKNLSDPNPINLSSLVNNDYCNGLFEDREGNVWFSTNNNGVYVLYNSPFLQFTKDNSKLKSNYVFDIDGNDKGRIYLASEGGILTVIEGKEIIAQDQTGNTNREVYDVFVTQEEDILIGQYLSLRYSFDEKRKQLIKEDFVSIYKMKSSLGNKEHYEKGKFFFNSKRFTEKPDGSILAALYQYVILMEEDKAMAYACEESVNIKTYGILPYKENLILSGSNRGLYEVGPFVGEPDSISDYIVKKYPRKDNLERRYVSKSKWEEVTEDSIAVYSYPIIRKKIFKGNQTIDSYIYDMQYAKDSSCIWIATQKNGIYQIIDDSIHQNYTASETGLSSNICNRIFVDVNNKAWVSTIQGINIIDPQSNVIKKITTDDGLISNHVTSVYIYDSLVYAGTSKGLSLFHERDINTRGTEPPILIKELRINENDTLVQDRYILPHNKNSLYLSFVGLTYKGKVQYRYQMEGLSSDWIYTEDNHVRFPELRAGNYTFRVQSITKNGLISKTIASTKFKIKRHPLKSRLAYLIYGLLFLGGVTAYIQFRISNIRRKEKENTKINKKFAELELQALQSQMNPHFVFNALGAIQSFILLNDDRSANRYLSDFADLMRLFLESSKEKYINLSDELKLLTIYIKLEQLRFEDKFKCNIEVDPNIDLENHEIPSLLLQPFVENAINHGLRYKEDQGLLQVIFSIDENTQVLKCIIEDDGVGRKKSKEIQKKSFKGYKSRGTQIVDERLKIINLLDSKSVDIQIVDLEENGESKGTRVEIKLELD